MVGNSPSHTSFLSYLKVTIHSVSRRISNVLKPEQIKPVLIYQIYWDERDTYPSKHQDKPLKKILESKISSTIFESLSINFTSLPAKSRAQPGPGTTNSTSLFSHMRTGQPSKGWKDIWDNATQTLISEIRKLRSKIESYLPKSNSCSKAQGNKASECPFLASVPLQVTTFKQSLYHLLATGH